MDHIKKELLHIYFSRISASWEIVHIQGIIEDPSISESILPTEDYTYYTQICVESSPTRLTLYSPTHSSKEFYPEFSRKAGPTPRIQLALSQDHP